MLLIAGLLFATSATAGAALRTRTTAASSSVTLTAASHTAHAGKPWQYEVQAVGPSGQALPGTVVLRAIAFGHTFDKIGQFGFKGTLRRTYTWSSMLGGTSPIIEARVTIGQTTHVLRYSVHVNADTGKPRFHATIVGSGHVARPGSSWYFIVRALDQNGNSVHGTAIVRVVADGQFVDTVGWIGFKKKIVRTYSWSPVLRGTLALMQARVIGPGGTRTVAYAVHIE
jgi:hypothetical protein